MRLLLDEQLSPAIATGLRRRRVDVVALRAWSGPAGLGASDSDLLSAAFAGEWVVVSYDRRTLEPLLRAWAEDGQHHGGVVLVDERTLRPNDAGGLVRALRALDSGEGARDWQDRVVFLQRG